MSISWSRATRPHLGELLSSALIRIAHDHGLSAWRFADLHWPGNRVWTRDIDRFPNPVVLSDWASLGGVDYDALIEASLVGETATLGQRGTIVPMIAAAGMRNLSRRRHAMAFCPGCLTEQPMVWRKAWRLAFVVGCPRHQCRLLDACPRCGGTIEPHRNQNLGRDACPECWNTLTIARRQPVDGYALALQGQLLALLSGATGLPLGLPEHRFRSLEVAGLGLIPVRSLMSIVSAPTMRRRIREAVGYPEDGSVRTDIRHVELARLDWRHETLAILGRWLSPWPDRFLEVARAVGLTRQAFARLPTTRTLEAMLAELPERYRGHTTKPPMVHDRLTRRLRRHDGEGYRQRRAGKLMAATSPGASTS